MSDKEIVDLVFIFAALCVFGLVSIFFIKDNDRVFRDIEKREKDRDNKCNEGEWDD